ncbi:MAG: lipocalin-like domain-containing protein [Pseudomonadota bacterium]
MTTPDGSALLGCWALVSCREEGGGPETEVFGADSVGQLQYTPEGRMSASLMSRSWPQMDINEEWRVGQYISYTGVWKLVDGCVRHEVQTASVPAWVGREFVRAARLEGDILTLSVDPKTSGSGETIPHVLVWRKIA